MHPPGPFPGADACDTRPLVCRKRNATMTVIDVYAAAGTFFRPLRKSLASLFPPLFLLFVATSLLAGALRAQKKAPTFRVIAIAEHGGIHKPFVDRAKIGLDKLAADKNFAVDYVEDTEKIDEAFLAQYSLFLQLDYPPYSWTDQAQTAFIKYIDEGEGGWIGFHHPTLLGEFDGFPMSPWFHDFMGGIRFKNYIATFVTGEVTIEDKNHPAMKGIPSPFTIRDEEFYTYDKSPRVSVHVLASVDEKTYAPNSDIKMGDHPVVWTNERKKARNIYIFMGHRPEHFDNKAFTQLFENSIFWAAGQEKVGK